MRSRSVVACVLATVLPLVAGCSTGISSGAPASNPVTPAPTIASPVSAAPSLAVATARVAASPNPMDRPTVSGAFAVAKDGRKLELRCWGEGSPTVILEAGAPSAGLEQFGTDGRAFTGRLAEQRRTCAYDRAGYSPSDPPPMEPRDLDDVTDDLHALLAAARLEGPYVLVGSSFGGMIVTYYAHRFPDGVRGVVLLDVPAPSATLNLTEAPELAWDSPQNPENTDIVPEFENRLAKEQFPFKAPLLVITATRGQSNVADQTFWLKWSSDSRQVELDGEHTIYNDQPVAVADAILAMGD